jgi:Immunity protein 53
MSDDLRWLQRWYLGHCDGKWEHGFGLEIQTLDNPGWHVTIALEGTELVSAVFELTKRESSETDWLECRVVERNSGVSGASPNYRRFEAHGGPMNLGDIISVFRAWAEEASGPKLA